MEDEIKAMLDRQAKWQRSRSDRAWAEKLQQCQAARDSMLLSLAKIESVLPKARRHEVMRESGDEIDYGMR